MPAPSRRIRPRPPRNVDAYERDDGSVVVRHGGHVLNDTFVPKAEADDAQMNAEALAEFIEKNVPGAQVMRPEKRPWFVVT